MVRVKLLKNRKRRFLLLDIFCLKGSLSFLLLLSYKSAVISSLLSLVLILKKGRRRKEDSFPCFVGRARKRWKSFLRTGVALSAINCFVPTVFATFSLSLWGLRERVRGRGRPPGGCEGCLPFVGIW